jgi:hypothetical protein
MRYPSDDVLTFLLVESGREEARDQLKRALGRVALALGVRVDERDGRFVLVEAPP